MQIIASLGICRDSNILWTNGWLQGCPMGNDGFQRVVTGLVIDTQETHLLHILKQFIQH